MVPELGMHTLREILIYSYRIIYRVQEEAIEVVTVYHGARLLDARKIERR